MANRVDLAATVAQVASAGQGSAHAPPSGAARYELGREIGRGGMGRVIEALDRQFERTVAIKELLAVDAGTRARFATEALVTGNLEHPGIPTVYERGLRDDGSAFYVMRRVRGRTLAQAIADAHSLEERLQLLPVLVRTAQTLGYAHDQGVIHRDVKPENIVLGTHGESVLLDWGIAKVRGVPTTERGLGPTPTDAPAAGSTQHGSVLGTPAYMAPEQARGAIDEIDERTDVFALGALLYHLLAGRPPYQGKSVAELVDRAAQGRPAPLAQIAPQAPADLRAVCERAMARDPEARYRNADELAAALENLMTSAVAARPSRLVGAVANAVVFLCMLGMLIATALIWHFQSSFRNQGLGAGIYLFMGVAGSVLSIVEWRTGGRYALSSVCLVLAISTFFAGVMQWGTGVSNVLGGLIRMPDFENAEKYRAIMTIGMHEVAGILPICAAMTVFQLLLWGAARRAVALRAQGVGSSVVRGVASGSVRTAGSRR